MDYAVGGAAAVLFYAEPARSYDVDVFVLLDEQTEESLNPLAGIHEWARQQGFPVDAEHVVMHDVPVQFLPPYSPLAREAVTTGRVLSYEGVPVRVVAPEHLAALALRPWERPWPTEP